MLTSEHKNFLLVHQSLVPAGFNFVINGLIAWLLFRSLDTLTLWGEHGIAGDLLITAFLLPMLTCLIVSPLITKQVRNKKLSVLSSALQAAQGMATKALVLRALFLGVVGLIFAAAPIVWLLDLVESQGVTIVLGSLDYALYKAVWAALMAMVITPVIAWWALQSASKA